MEQGGNTAGQQRLAQRLQQLNNSRPEAVAGRALAEDVLEQSRLQHEAEQAANARGPTMDELHADSNEGRAAAEAQAERNLQQARRETVDAAIAAMHACFEAANKINAEARAQSLLIMATTPLATAKYGLGREKIEMLRDRARELGLDGERANAAAEMFNKIMSDNAYRPNPHDFGGSGQDGGRRKSYKLRGTRSRVYPRKHKKTHRKRR